MTSNTRSHGDGHSRRPKPTAADLYRRKIQNALEDGGLRAAYIELGSRLVSLEDMGWREAWSEFNAIPMMCVLPGHIREQLWSHLVSEAAFSMDEPNQLGFLQSRLESILDHARSVQVACPAAEVLRGSDFDHRYGANISPRLVRMVFPMEECRPEVFRAGVDKAFRMEREYRAAAEEVSGDRCTWAQSIPDPNRQRTQLPIVLRKHLRDLRDDPDWTSRFESWLEGTHGLRTVIATQIAAREPDLNLEAIKTRLSIIRTELKTGRESL